LRVPPREGAGVIFAPMHRTGGKPFEVIAIAGSAGGVNALVSLVSWLPRDVSASVIVVQHLPFAAESDLVGVLASRSALPVKWAEAGELLKQGTIYVAPRRCRITVRRRRLKVEPCERGALGTPSADPLFHSLAVRYGPQAIGVVLTGALWDGAAGVQAMKRCGATILIQDPETAIASGMPRAAIGTFGLHFVLPLERIALALSTLVMVPDVVPVLTNPDLPLKHWLQYKDNSRSTSAETFSTPYRTHDPSAL